MKKLLLVVLLSGCSGAIHAENDFFLPGNRNQDKYFTHGTRFDYFKETENEKETYSLGQNIYTPSEKTSHADPAVLAHDRSYTGWLYGEYRDSTIDKNIKDTWGIQLGCEGPCSFARQSQTFVHNLIGQKVPTWDRNYELKSEPGFILEKEKEYAAYSVSNTMDFSVYGNSKFGNIIDSLGVGMDVRAGYNLSRWSSDPIIFKMPKKISPYTAYLFARAEERYVAYAHLLEGSLFQSEKHTVNTERFVNEFDIGIALGYNKYQFIYRITEFSPEWKEKKENFYFGGISFEW